MAETDDVIIVENNEETTESFDDVSESYKEETSADIIVTDASDDTNSDNETENISKNKEWHPHVEVVQVCGL